MITFDVLLKDLESFFRCSLQPDQMNSCLIRLNSGLHIQIEVDRHGYLLIGALVAVLSPSRYRDLVVREALKSNNFSPPSLGSFGYSTKTNQLIFSLVFDEPEIQSDKILAVLPAFIKKGEAWFDSLKQGEIPSFQAETTPAYEQANIFGLRR